MDREYKLVVSNMYRAKNKLAFFAMHQIINKMPEFDIEFHILWHDDEYKDKWSKKIDNYGFNLVSYTIEDMNNYALEMGIKQEKIDVFHKFISIYFIILAHYLRKNNITDYYLIYDDDIILKDDIDELKKCLKDKISVLISEPMNPGCDKVLSDKLIELFHPFQNEALSLYLSRNPNRMGFNAGFQGISLEMYDDFLTKDMFSFLIDIFNYRGIYNDDGEEIWGTERTMIDTQQQSFFSTLNILKSTENPHILNPDEYFVVPNWGEHPKFGTIDPANEFDGWDVNMKSKVVHFIGHSTDPVSGFTGKSKIFLQKVDEYLRENNL